MASNGPEIILEILFNVAMLPSFCDKIENIKSLFLFCWDLNSIVVEFVVGY